MTPPVGRVPPDGPEPQDAWPPSALDHEFCDACHGPANPHISQAYVLYQLRTGRLALCQHHARTWGEQLAALDAVILADDRDRLRPRGALYD